MIAVHNIYLQYKIQIPAGCPHFDYICSLSVCEAPEADTGISPLIYHFFDSIICFWLQKVQKNHVFGQKLDFAPKANRVPRRFDIQLYPKKHGCSDFSKENFALETKAQNAK